MHFRLMFRWCNLWTVGILLCHTLITVNGQCSTGVESSCIWTHDSNSPYKWASKYDSGVNWVQLTNCDYPQCGVAMIRSPNLPQKPMETSINLEYKIYGYSEVYLRMFLVTKDTKAQIFSKVGNYGVGFPDTWSSETITVPPVPTGYHLMLKAYTPYKEALLAVKGIRLEATTGNSNANPSSQSSKPGSNEEREPSASESIASIEDILRTTGERENYDESLEMTRALKKRYFREQDLELGFTAVVVPEICYNYS